MLFGTCFLPPGCRYSLHRHGQPEIYYCIEGRGQIYRGEKTIDVEPGIAVYIPKNCVHGAQNSNARPLHMIWIYGTESSGSNWSWTPVEDIYLDAQ